MKTKQLILLASLIGSVASAQQIADFTSLKPLAQTDQLQIPATHTFQVLRTAGTILSDGSVMGVFPDFTGFVPKTPGNSTEGYLCINSEALPGGMSVHELQFEPTTKTWTIGSSANPSFLLLGTSGFNCSGGVTPWGTAVTCEETYLIQDDALPEPPPDINQDGHPDLGWVTEIDPITKEVVDYDGDGTPDKVWQMGRMKHENACFTPDGTTAYEGVDDGDFGFIFKYVMDVPQKLASGKLYVLKASTDSSGSFTGAGTWILMENTSAAQQNTMQDLAAAAGATNFRRVEDVEVGTDGQVYFAATSPGHVYRFRDTGTEVAGLGIFAAKGKYPTQTATGIDTVSFDKCDNLVFDCDGNLWVTEDGDFFHIWVIGPDHTTQRPNIRLFMTSMAGPDEPSGSLTGAEPTGLTFTPDCQFGFMSFQRCNPLNRAGQEDASGNSVNWNLDPTIVFARKEVLGDRQVSAIRRPLVEQFQLYPNPANRVINVDFELTAAKELTISVTSAIGQVVGKQQFKGQAGQNTIKFDTYLFPAGTYQLVVSDGSDKAVVSKFLKFE